ncbi:MAG: molecular chaperone DnaJ [Pseudomonadota bacterium]
MPRLLLVLAIILVLYILYRRTQTVPPHLRRGEYIKLGLAAAVGIVLVLTITGKMHWLGIAATGLLVLARSMLPLLIRYFPMLASKVAQGGVGAGQSSTVETSLLRMQLAHDSGDLEGEVLNGKFKGWRLADMNREQLEEFMYYCRQEDDDSARLLDSYMQQRFPGEGPFGDTYTANDSSGTLDRNEALKILGLDEGANREDIVAAHRSLMQKLHPDRGGNDYLAAKINQAKDVLLG